jgi:hypothetical protein
MAYGSVQWTDTTVASTSHWSITLTHGYAQNPNTNRSKRYCSKFVVKSAGTYGIYNNYSNSAQSGIKANTTASGPTYVTYNISVGGSYTFSPGTVTSSEVYHNADGTPPSYPTVSWYFDPGQYESTLTDVQFPSYTRAAWHSITPSLPKISRTQPASTSTVSSISHSTCTLNLSGTCSSYNSISEYKYRINSGSDVTTTSKTISLSGLSAGTSYTIHTWVKDNWGWWSQDKTLTFTTLTSGSSTTTTNGWPLIKVNGIWRNVTTPYIKVSGAQKAATKVYVKVSGAWKACK